MAFTMSDPSAELDPFEAEAAIDAPQWVTAGEPSSGLGVHGVDPVPAAPPPGGALVALDESASGELPVPRIAIHFFCRNEETAAAATRAAGDRRLSRATPKVCDPNTKVVVIGASNDIALYRELMRRGVSEYLVPPIQPLQLIRTIAGLYADPTTPFVGRTVGFVGSKGGVGASTLAHNIAHTLAEQVKVNTVIADYDLAFGTAGLDFNQDPLQGVYDALHQPDRLDPVLLDRMTARCTDRLSLFAAPATLDDVYEFGPDVFEEVFNRIRTTAPFVIMDIPHTWNTWVKQTILACDDVILVCPGVRKSR